MREQLSKYVELLFAGTTDTEEIRQEILQNSLDKYDDLVSQGKTPEAAYRLTISGIGDINEVLGQPSAAPTQAPDVSKPQEESTENNRKLLRSIAIALYILSAIPTVFTYGSSLGVCLTVLLVAVATAIIVYAGKSKTEAAPNQAGTTETQIEANTKANKKSPGRKAAESIIGGVGICVYIVVSFITGAWGITWLIFPMIGCIQGITTAIFDLKEGSKK